MLFAVIVTILVVLGYGARAGWNALTREGSSETPSTSESGYLASVNRSIFFGGAVVAGGINVRLVVDIEAFVNATNQAIGIVEEEQGNLQRLAPSSSGAEADLFATTGQSLENLRVAMIKWRDAVSSLRLGLVDGARAAVEGAIAQLQADAEQWRSLPG